MKTLISTASAFLLISTTAFAATFTSVESKIGKVLAGENGMTLYTFSKDATNKSNCNGGCAQSWPPLYADASDKAQGPYSVIKRDDGTMQWAKDGQPLYFWVNDRRAGDTTGHGVGGAWAVARP